MPQHFFGKFSGICVAVLLCLTIHYAQCDSLLRPELVKITLVCLINRHASGLQQVLKKFSESSCSLTQDLASTKEKKHKEMPVTKQEAHLQPSLGWVLVKEIKFFLGLHCSHC